MTRFEKLLNYAAHGSNCRLDYGVSLIDEVLLIGYGNQAKSWALNLRDSGVNVFIGLRESSLSKNAVESAGLKYVLLNESLEKFKYVVILTPDDTHLNILLDIKLSSGTSLYYAHGYSVIENQLPTKFPQFNHILLAPKAIASELRFQYEIDGKLGAVYSLEFLADESKAQIEKDVFDLARAIGITSGPHLSTFKNETYADLFSEQTILCCILPYVSNSVFKKLRQKGVEPETAYFEAWYEVKLIADTLIKIGPEKFFNLISPNALIGSEVGREALITSQFEDTLDKILDNIYSGKFQKLIEGADLEKIRNDVQTYWKNQELTHVHKGLKDELFR